MIANRDLSKIWLNQFWEAVRDDCARFLFEMAAHSHGYHTLVDRIHHSLEDYVFRGPGLGSAFVLAAYRGYHGDRWFNIVRVATAQELLSKSVLIVDDIIDEDRARWDADSFHVEFEKYAYDQGWKEPERIGQCSGVLGAQILTTLAHLALFSADLPNSTICRINQTILRALKALDEMQLVDLAFENLVPTSKQWLSMATQRGATHVAACLEVGAILAKQPISEKRILIQAGTELGYIYDIRADLIDAYGTAGPKTHVGRDLRMRKKPLFLCAALENAPAEVQRELHSLLQSTSCPSPRILEIAAHWGVPAALDQLKLRERNASKLIQESNLTPSGKQFFDEIITRATTHPVISKLSRG
jgi:geranylgeranyl pyrophosphate synthase